MTDEDEYVIINKATGLVVYRGNVPPAAKVFGIWSEEHMKNQAALFGNEVYKKL